MSTETAVRPGGATAIGVLNIVFGGISLITGLISLAGAFAYFSLGGAAIVLGLVNILGFLFTIIEIVAGIMLLVNKRSGITLSYAYAIANIAITVLSYVLTLTVSSALGGLSGGAGAAVAGIGILFLLLAIAYSVVILIVLRSESIKTFYANR